MPKRVTTILFLLFALLAYVIPLSIALRSVMLGTFPFWFDPARDLLLAWGNLHKFTLIGPPSGIPGIFYGPYWIWWISLAMLISPDPRFIDFFCLTSLYFILFPFILYKFSKVFGQVVSLLLWTFFILAFLTYSFYIWNPHVAAVLTLLSCYLIATADYTKKSLRKLFFAGMSVALVLNTHISFGSAVLLGSSLFLIIHALLLIIKNKKKEIINQLILLTSFVCGFVLLYIPFFFFELRHGFGQIHTFIRVMTTDHSVVGYQGLPKDLIISLFFGKLVDIFQIPSLIIYSLVVIALCLIFLKISKKKIHFSPIEMRLSSLCALILISTLTIYISTKNPVWNYHFIGVEIPFLLLAGIILSKVKIFQIIACIWAVFLLFHTFLPFFGSLWSNPMAITSFSTEQAVVDQIYHDANNKRFVVYAYNPAIYTYDYDYLFLSTAKTKKYSLPLKQTNTNANIYLILPAKQTPVLEDFIHSHIPSKKYKIVRKWVTQDQTMIIKATKE